MNAAYNEISCVDAAKMIGIEYSSVAKWCKSGKINCINVSGGTEKARYVIKEAEVQYIKLLRQKFGREYMQKYRKDWEKGKQLAENTESNNEVVYVESTKPQVAVIKSVVTNITTEQPTRVDIDEIAIKIGYIQDIKDKIEKLEQEKQKLIEEYDKLRAEVINAL